MLFTLQEERESFDIHVYGSRVLGTFPENPDSTQELREAKFLPFQEVVRSKPTEEVSRYFLATLQLVSSGIAIFCRIPLDLAA